MPNNSVVLQIGFTAYEPSWEMILQQIGIRHTILSENESLLNDYSAIIVNSDIESGLQIKINDFVQHGGSVLYTTKARKKIQERRTSISYVHSIPPAVKEFYQFFSILDLYSNVVHFGNNDFIDAERTGSGWEVFFGIDLDVVFSLQTKRKNFYRSSGRMPNEMVHKRSNGAFRQLIFSVLKKMHHLRKIPFVHQWYFPGSEPTIFTMRIDSDKGSQKQVDDIFTISEEHTIPTSWFLDVKSHESWLPYFRKFTSQEIGVHCYEHSLHRSTILNQENFAKALSLLRENNLDPKGITAPTGAWNKEYAEAIELLGFQYSSEFAYDYDNLPSFPFINGKFTSLPQLPIHPVCIGTMLRAQMSVDEMKSYFRSVIDTNYLLNEPIALYHHPTHEQNEVIEEVFRYINERKIAKFSYTQYSDWWKQRSLLKGQLRYSNDTIEMTSGDADAMYRIILPDDRESITNFHKKIDLKSSQFTTIKRDLSKNEHIMRSRSFDLRHLLQNALDWWITTTE